MIERTLNGDTFKEKFAALWDLYVGKELNSHMMKLYYDALCFAKVTDDEYAYAIAAITSRHKWNNIPKPGEIIEIVEAERGRIAREQDAARKRRAEAAAIKESKEPLGPELTGQIDELKKKMGAR